MKFSKASSKDGDQVVTARCAGWNVKCGQSVILIVKARWSNSTYTVKFTCNRKDGSTIKTTEWPKRFAKPSIGEPVEYEVIDGWIVR